MVNLVAFWLFKYDLIFTFIIFEYNLIYMAIDVNQLFWVFDLKTKSGS
jgi:hypothetical protein